METNLLASKSLFLLALSALFGCSPKPQSSEPTQTCNDVILHAWSWSFNSIRENLPDIAEAGYTIVQTSPVQHCVTTTKEDSVGGMQLYGDGRWYYHYQPTDWKIGNYQLGTREELIMLCQEAEKYGIRIIVDVLPNHTAVDDSQVEPDLDAAVGRHENLYHAAGFTEITDYNDRRQCTTGMMGGLPDVNTENPDFQHYFLSYLNDLLACGVRGFRYDTAKHIGLPSDPLDERATENDFWPVVTGRKEVKGLSLAMPADELFIYGEVLQDENVKETEYAEYMGLTASSLGFVLRNALEQSLWQPKASESYHHPVSADKLITWVESHDTYCNEHISAGLTDQQIALGWAFLAARQQGTPLFYSRPDGSNGPEGDFWGNNLVGAKGNDNFKSPLVVAANHFRHHMQGQPESLSFAKNGSVCLISRGQAGALLINLSSMPQEVKLSTTLNKGSYTDQLSGQEWQVKRNKLRGTIAPLSCAIFE